MPEPWDHEAFVLCMYWHSQLLYITCLSPRLLTDTSVLVRYSDFEMCVDNCAKCHQCARATRLLPSCISSTLCATLSLATRPALLTRLTSETIPSISARFQRRDRYAAMLMQGRSAQVLARSNRAQIVKPGALSARGASVKCNAASSVTAWDAWSNYMNKRGAISNFKEQEPKYEEMGSLLTKIAQGYKPKFTSAADAHGPSFKLQHVDKIELKELPKDLHDKLETIGVAALEAALNLDACDYLNASFTTTDIDGALSVTGTILQSGKERSAVLAFVATETERQASWSRLEGLILHWACTASNGGAWAMPPEGWNAVPNNSRDAGGAIQCQFEKQLLGSNNEPTFVLVMQLPLRGILKSGGLVWVLKGTANQTDRWLKDNATRKDFYLDLQTLPVTQL